jgi:hypothetical protein
VVACTRFAERVVGSFWWLARFPELTLEHVPIVAPGRSDARVASYAAEPRPTITLPRRYRTKGIVLHELAHWALDREPGLALHGPAFARLLLDATHAFLGPHRAAALEASFEREHVRVSGPPRPHDPHDGWGGLDYGWEERRAPASQSSRRSSSR